MVSQLMLEWALVITAAILTALATLYWLLPGLERSTDPTLTPKFLDNAPVWIFDDTRLTDATPEARRYLDTEDWGVNWSDLRACLSPRFPGFPETPILDGSTSDFRLSSCDEKGDAFLIFESIGGLTRVHLHENVEEKPAIHGVELSNLRGTLNLTPYPIWTLDDVGHVDETNFAYDRLAQIALPNAPERSAPIFPILRSDIDSGKIRRVPIVEHKTGRKIWFDIQVVSNEQAQLCFAINVDAVVDAENAQRKFVQTLAKTFAQLSIGLAIFDRQRQLALFNPALIDLTNLSAEFLSARPTLFSFFDRMRNERMMPEPKDYTSWRQKISELIEAAADGSYQETWTLPSGSVYSISGRPHPDGAIAFLFEDITAEITLTRRFRSDIELSQTILDQLDEAIVVFGSDGTITVTNQSYRNLWSTDPEKSFAATTVIDATRLWQDQCKATPAWGEIRDFVALRDTRVEWFADISLLSGVRMQCQISPINNGASMVVFSKLREPVAAPKTQTQNSLTSA